MPLKNDASTKSRQYNILTEIHAGKKPKQAVAIGYAMQRKAAGKKARSKRS